MDDDLSLEATLRGSSAAAAARTERLSDYMLARALLRLTRVQHPAGERHKRSTLAAGLLQTIARHGSCSAFIAADVSADSPTTYRLCTLQW